MTVATLTRPAMMARGHLPAPPEHSVLVHVDMGLRGPVAIWADAAGASVLRTDPECELLTLNPAPAPAVSVTIVEYDDTCLMTGVTRVPALRLRKPKAQRLPDGRYVVTGSRVPDSTDPSEHATVLIDQNGSVVARGRLGGGIRHLMVSGDGSIWAGYSHEGIAGPVMGTPTHVEQVGAAGVVAWSRLFDRLWSHRQSFVNISDCNAMNIDGGAVWVCSLLDFPLLKIVGGVEQVYRTEGLGGPRGVLVSGDEVGFIGSYRCPGELVVGYLDSGAFHATGRTTVSLPDGSPLPCVPVHCRGPLAHYFIDGEWFVLDLREVPHL